MIDASRKNYDKKLQEWAIRNIDEMRVSVFLKPLEAAGTRFNDTFYVLAVLESMTPQAEFVEYPLTAIEKALRDSARADYWYQNEKDYGAHEMEGLESVGEDTNGE